MNRHKRNKMLLTTAALALAPVLTGCQTWGPLTSSYNGHVVVKGEGYTNNSTSSVLDHLDVTDPISDGNAVHGHARFLFYVPVPNGLGDVNMQWVTSSDHSTPDFSNTEREYNYSSSLRSDSSRGRVQSYVCAQMGWPVPDSCSNSAFDTFDY